MESVAYRPRPHAFAPHAPSTRIEGRPSLHSQAEPTPAPGDHHYDLPTSERGAGPFGRGKSGREHEGSTSKKAAGGPSTGLVAWAALEPALVKAGLADRTMEAEAALNAAAEKKKAAEAAAAAGGRRSKSDTGSGFKDDYMRQLARELGREPPAW